MHEAASYGQMAGHKENRWPSPRSSSCVKLHERYHLVLLEVLEAGLRVRLDGVSALLPLGRADLAVLAGELVALDEPQDLVRVTADIRLVHGEVLDDTIWVDDGGTTEGVAGIAHVPAVLLADLATEVADERVLHRTETTLLAGSVDPGEVGEDGVDGKANDLAVDGLELVIGLAEGDDLGRADEGEVERVGEEDQPLALVLAQLNILEVKVWVHSLCLEGWGWLADDSVRAFLNLLAAAHCESEVITDVSSPESTYHKLNEFTRLNLC